MRAYHELDVGVKGLLHLRALALRPPPLFPSNYLDLLECLGVGC